jgi:glucose-6-phosphate isomerase
MSYLKLDVTKTKGFYDEKVYLDLEKEIYKSYDTLRNKNGLGNDYLGWLDLPLDYDKDEFRRIKEAAKKIKTDSDVLLSIGIGGSYLGAKSAVEMLKPYFGTNKNGVEVIFVGNHISSTYIADLKDYLKDKDFSINVISKSGTTTEPSIAFRIFKDLLIEKYGNDAAKRIYATTDKKKGALKTEADALGYQEFVVPDDVGGRYSVLTAVGLLPIACAGIDIDSMMEGALTAHKDYNVRDINKNDAMKYALLRNVLYKSGKKLEMLVNYEPKLIYFSEWWKQLFGESEGKNNKGIWITSASFSTDLHSLGQMIQQGERTIFETVISVEKPEREIKINKEESNLDGLNFLAGKDISYVNKMAMEGTMLAHVEGGVPNIRVTVPEISAFTYGYMVYFFELACGISAYTLGVNPFDQPGVESYKKNMFALLGKPGYEEMHDELVKKLKQ